ncbi:MAG: cupin domain-containing protein [Aequorivita antarctica]|tara:strand:- start:3981 stop:4454 length:474 start_codon:yes stop_codon:yes gene_type:complete
MNFKNRLVILLVGAALFSCNQKQTNNAEVQQSLVFPKGELIENNNFTGNAYLSMMVYADSINKNSVGNVTFEPGARTNWHSHPNGQIILAIDGKGYYQEKGSPKKILLKGDVVKCPANIPHWHGASEDSEFIQVAITSRVDGPTEWLEVVTDEEYLE